MNPEDNPADEVRVCEVCDTDYDEHDFQHLARYCYPERVKRLEAQVVACAATHAALEAAAERRGWTKAKAYMLALTADWIRLDAALSYMPDEPTAPPQPEPEGEE